MADPSLSDSSLRYLDAVANNPDPVVTTTEIAEKLEVTQQAVYNSFKELEQKGMLRSKKVGARSKVWWLSIQGRQALADD